MQSTTNPDDALVDALGSAFAVTTLSDTMAAQSGNTTMTSETPSEKPSKRSGDELKRACVDTVTPNREQLADLFALVLRLKTCMFTTRRVDGHLISRPMMLLEKHREVDLWFAANAESHKFDELEHDEHVNLAFVHQTTAGVTEWASIAGVAAIVKDREHVENLYWPEVKTWLKDCGDGVHDGGSDDPRLLLILVKIHCAAYQMQDRSTVNALLGMAKGMFVGYSENMSTIREIEPAVICASRKLEE